MQNVLRNATHLHAHACRHCNHYEIPCLNSYASILLATEGSLEFLIDKIEDNHEILDEISFFCEKCHRISVISFECYAKTAQELGCLQFSVSNHTAGVYKTPLEYYTSLVASFQNKQCPL